MHNDHRMVKAEKHQWDHQAQPLSGVSICPGLTAQPKVLLLLHSIPPSSQAVWKELSQDSSASALSTGLSHGSVTDIHKLELPLYPGRLLLSQPQTGRLPWVIGKWLWAPLGIALECLPGHQRSL